MKKSALDDVLRSYDSRAPLGKVPSAINWSDVEIALGRSIPDDFKKIVQRTGGCPMGACYLRNPAEVDNIFISLSHGGLMLVYSQVGNIARERLGVVLYPEPGGLLSIAFVDSTYFCIEGEKDEIVILDLLGAGVCHTGLRFADLMMTMFTDRDLYDGLGETIWGTGDSVF